MGNCLPGSRDLTGDLVSISNASVFTSRVVSWNNPGDITWVRWGLYSKPPGLFPRGFFDPPIHCQDNPDERKLCIAVKDMLFDPAFGNGPGGMREMRLSPNISSNDLGARQFATLNYQIYLKNGNDEDNYRSTNWPIGRAWYTGFDYSNVTVDYMEHFASLDQIIPTVSGVVELDIDHQKGSGTNTSYLWLDPNFHDFPEFWETAEEGDIHSSGMTLIYKKEGLFDNTFQWDTTSLADGTHALLFQTQSESGGASNVGGLKLLFNVNNGNTEPPPPPPPSPDPDPNPPCDAQIEQQLSNDLQAAQTALDDFLQQCQ